MGSLFNEVKAFVQTYGPESTYWVAYSGGLDSHVLLHLFANLRSVYPLKLRAVYINHGLSQNADHWAEHCAAVCQTLNVDFTQHAIDVSRRTSGSPENNLRECRYEIFACLLNPNDFLLTAHQQNDQAETVLLQLLRGAGPKGLAAMPCVKPFAQGMHGRPLLNFTRADLKNYAEQNHLQWIEDESNKNVSFTRNFLRHEVLPILAERWPTVTKTLARVAENCAENQELLELITQQDLENVKGSAPNTLSVKKLLALDVAKQSLIVRVWLEQLNFPLPSKVKIQQILHTVLRARSDKTPHVAWQDVEARRYRDDLFFLPKMQPLLVDHLTRWDLSTPLKLSNEDELQATPAQGEGLRRDVKNVTVRFRQGGEVFLLPGRQHHHELKKLFQDWGVPPWMRDRVPLIYVVDTLAAIVGFCIADEFAAKNQQEGWLLSVRSINRVIPEVIAT